MTKKDEEFIKSVLDSEIAKGKRVYVDTTAIKMPNAIFFSSEPYFSQMEDREKAVDDKFQELVSSFDKKGDLFHKRFSDQMRFDEKGCKDRLRKRFDALKRRESRQEIPDGSDVLAFFIQGKPKESYAKATVFVRTDKPKTLPFLVCAIRGCPSWECNVDVSGTLGALVSEPKEDSEDIPYPMLRLDYVPSRQDKLALCALNRAQTTRFRQLKTHKFVGNAPSSSVGVLINGELAGVIGYNQAFTTFYGAFKENELFLQFSIACTPFDRSVKMGKLIDRVSLWDKCAKRFLNDYDKTKFTDIVSTSITPYPECKHARRLMSLRNKTYDAKSGMYKLVYGCEMTHESTLRQVFNEWMDELAHAERQKEKQNANA